MSDPIDVPRPAGPGPSDFADRVRALRGDARVGAAVLACVALAAGVAWFRAGIAPSGAPAASASTPSTSSASGSRAPASREQSTTLPAGTTSTTSGAIVVDVVGAVRAPGVVSLPATARVIDAIRAAGGVAAGADLTPLNLAAKLEDGARVAVPVAGRPPPPVDPNAVSGAADPAGTGTGSTSATGDPAAPVDVNTATLEQLETLPGIGPTLAAAMIQEREANGPFRSVDDLTRVHGIGQGRLAQLHDFVTV